MSVFLFFVFSALSRISVDAPGGFQAVSRFVFRVRYVIIEMKFEIYGGQYEQC